MFQYSQHDEQKKTESTHLSAVRLLWYDRASWSVQAICVSPRCTILCTFACTSPPAAGLFSRFLIRDAQAPRPYTDGVHLGLGQAPWRALWASEVARAGFNFIPPRRGSQGPGNPTKSFFFLSSFWLCCRLILARTTPSIKLSSSRLRRSHGATSVAHQALPFVTATDGASMCVCVCAMFPVDQRCNGLNAALGGGAGRHPHFLGVSKATALPRCTLRSAAVRSDSTSASHSSLGLRLCACSVFTRTHAHIST